MMPDPIDENVERGNLEYLSDEFDFHLDDQQRGEGSFTDLAPALQEFRVTIFVPQVCNTNHPGNTAKEA
jgi:hypothetical protein